MPEPRVLVLRAHPLPLQGREEHNSALITTCCKKVLHGLPEGQLLAITLSPYPTGESRQDAYWRTLIAHMSVTWEPSPASYSEGFRAWLNLLHFRQVQPSMQDVQQADSFRVAFRKPWPWPHILHHTVGYMDNRAARHACRRSHWSDFGCMFMRIWII